MSIQPDVISFNIKIGKFVRVLNYFGERKIRPLLEVSVLIIFNTLDESFDVSY